MGDDTADTVWRPDCLSANCSSFGLAAFDDHRGQTRQWLRLAVDMTGGKGSAGWGSGDSGRISFLVQLDYQRNPVFA